MTTNLGPLNTALINAAKDKKATRIVLIDLRGVSDICDFQFICSAQNEKQAQAIADHMHMAVKQATAMIPAAIEGKEKGHWVVLDYGSTITHVFYDYIRDYYSLETLWAKGKIINIPI